MWRLAFFAIVWTSWLMCNEMVFQGKIWDGADVYCGVITSSFLREVFLPFFFAFLLLIYGLGKEVGVGVVSQGRQWVKGMSDDSLGSVLQAMFGSKVLLLFVFFLNESLVERLKVLLSWLLSMLIRGLFKVAFVLDLAFATGDCVVGGLLPDCSFKEPPYF
ncbi:Uncharacterized protein TCM_044523 [Theobroma cacao]|uniref:Uncharacterized protein n=1 Tax=Theobroma cacao TaxID=3641 RepID=A0A061FQS0_THECC|nr:Uncharacterized protein TCM_044523 [Theobroma cacao]